MKPYPSWTCKECGLKHGSGQRAVSCWHFGQCDVCGILDVVTEPRDFGHFRNWNNTTKNPNIYASKPRVPSVRNELA
jgi:hypothetical protein